MVPFGERPGAWDELLEPANLAASGERLDAINRWVNWHVRFVEDAGSDEWSGAQNTLTRGYGDCEDFAIVKLALLEKAGVPADSMYLVIVRDTSGPRDHAVLAVRQDGNLKILDSRTDKLLTDQDVTDYIPIISYSGTFAWIYGTRQFDTEGQQASLHQSANLEVQPGQPSDRN